MTTRMVAFTCRRTPATRSLSTSAALTARAWLTRMDTREDRPQRGEIDRLHEMMVEAGVHCADAVALLSLARDGDETSGVEARPHLP